MNSSQMRTRVWDSLGVQVDRAAAKQLDSQDVPNADRPASLRSLAQSRADDEAGREAPRRRRWRR